MLLSDNTDQSKDQSQGYAATPAGLFKVLKESKEYTDEEIKSALESLGKLMKLKGTIGTSVTDTFVDIPTEYEIGDAYFINTPPTYNVLKVEKGDFIVAMDSTGNPVDWKVLQVNLVNTITATEELGSGNLVVASNSAGIKTLPMGEYGQLLSIDDKGALNWRSIEDKDTKYTFDSGNGEFSVSDGSGTQFISIGVPKRSETADKVIGSLSLQVGGSKTVSFDGSSTVEAVITPATVGAAAVSHEHDLSDEEVTGILPLTKGGLGIESVPSGEVLVGFDAVKITTKSIDAEAKENSQNLIESGAVYTAMQLVLEEATAVWEELE